MSVRAWSRCTRGWTWSPVSEQRCDVAVIGAGPAGAAAAVRAAEHGASVALIDEAVSAGGQIWRHAHSATVPRQARSWLSRLYDAVASGRVTFMSSTAVVDAVADGAGFRLVAQRRSDATVVSARSVILAPGARELFLPFPGCTLPGVLGAGGAQAMLKAGLRVEGRRVVVAGTGPLLLAAAAALTGAGAEIVVVAEQAPGRAVARFAAGLWRTPGRLLHAAALRSSFLQARYRTGTWVVRAHGAGRVQEAALTDGTRELTVPCDLLCAGYSLVPATELGRLLGCLLHDGAIACDELQQTTVPGIYSAGEACGIAGAESAVAQGEIAGLAAAGTEPPPALLRRRDGHAHFARRLNAAFALRPQLRDLPDADTIVCRCMDVRHGELLQYHSSREAKLFTRAGMGACQARVCGPAQHFIYGWAGDSVRTPVLPATIAGMINNNAPTAAQGDA
jgi:D-hydroxyproline dehydrogenase subunit alpha